MSLRKDSRICFLSTRQSLNLRFVKSTVEEYTFFHLTDCPGNSYDIFYMIQIYYDDWPEYELLDSGHCKKLERFGKYLVIREETKAWWQPRNCRNRNGKKRLPRTMAKIRAHGNFTGRFRRNGDCSSNSLRWKRALPRLQSMWGVFPEQAAHWRWIADQIRKARRREIRVLNLFAYTGVATLVAAAHGAAVTHVDSAKGVVAWGRRNQELSGLVDRPIRWIVDDAAKFVKREIRRQRQYDAILLDPPSFGRGPKRELWKIEQHLTELLADCRQVLSPDSLFVLLTMYSLDQSSLLIANLLRDMLRGLRRSHGSRRTRPATYLFSQSLIHVHFRTLVLSVISNFLMSIPSKDHRRQNFPTTKYSLKSFWVFPCQGFFPWQGWQPAPNPARERNPGRQRVHVHREEDPKTFG